MCSSTTLTQSFNDYHDPCSMMTSSLSRKGKLRIVQFGPIQPRLANYPVQDRGGRKRSFHASWFDILHAKDWLEYSYKIDRMFCFACKMFGVKGVVKGEPKV